MGCWEHLARLLGNILPPFSALARVKIACARAVHTLWCFWAPAVRPQGSGASWWGYLIAVSTEASCQVPPVEFASCHRRQLQPLRKMFWDLRVKHNKCLSVSFHVASSCTRSREAAHFLHGERFFSHPQAPLLPHFLKKSCTDLSRGSIPWSFRS